MLLASDDQAANPPRIGDRRVGPRGPDTLARYRLGSGEHRLAFTIEIKAA